MSGNPAEPDAASAAEQVRSALPDERERIGPVAIERLRKDDGRALILYTAIAPDAASDAATETETASTTDGGPPSEHR